MVGSGASAEPVQGDGPVTVKLPVLGLVAERRGEFALGGEVAVQGDKRTPAHAPRLHLGRTARHAGDLSHGLGEAALGSEHVGALDLGCVLSLPGQVDRGGRAEDRGGDGR